MRHNILAYAAGGVGKSSFIADAIAHIHKKTGKVGRVIGADGGGTEAALAPLGEIASYWPIDRWEDFGSIFATMEKACKGWWPEDPLSAGSNLMPPFEVSRPCPTCGKHSGAGALGGIAACASCKKPIPAGHILKTVVTPVNGMDQVGLVAFEGMTAFGDLLMRRLRFKQPDGGRYLDDEGYKIAGGGKQHYMDAQNYLAQFIAMTRQILVDVVIWTALENRGDEEGKPIFGPKGPGKALTDTCIPWFTDVLHLDLVQTKDAKGMDAKDKDGVPILERKIFLSDHNPPDFPQHRFKAKTSAGADMPKVIPCSASVFFEEAEKAQEARRKKLLG